MSETLYKLMKSLRCIESVFFNLTLLLILTDMAKLALEKPLQWKVKGPLMNSILGRRYLLFISDFCL